MKLHPRWVLHLLPILLLEVKILHSFASLADLGEIPESLEPPACRTPELSRLLNRICFYQCSFRFFSLCPIKAHRVMCFDQLEPRLVHTLLHKLVSFDRLKHKEGLFFFFGHLLTSGGGDQEMADSGHISAVLLVFFFSSLCHPDTPRHPGHFYSPIVAWQGRDWIRQARISFFWCHNAMTFGNVVSQGFSFRDWNTCFSQAFSTNAAASKPKHSLMAAPQSHSCCTTCLRFFLLNLEINTRSDFLLL